MPGPAPCCRCSAAHRPQLTAAARQAVATLLALALLGAGAGAGAARAAAPTTTGTGAESAAAAAIVDPRIASLARHPVWLALLHQARRKLDRGSRAAFLEAGFFLDRDPDGAGDPERELRATVTAFSDPDPERARAARCRFPARLHFLREQEIVAAEGDACPALTEWRDQIGDVRLTLVYPEAFLGNPASMFGHTLLRFDPIRRETAADGQPLLGWTLDYSANAEDDVGALYLLRGLVGGYRGRFGIAPYYTKTKLYGDWQDRDIWEYPLAMTASGRERVLLHVWELRDVSLPYYFFTQNCSEKLLEVLEVGWPGLGRGGGFPPAVAPVDTVRAMAAVSEDAVGPPGFRPSPATRLQQAMHGLSDAERGAVMALAAGRLDPQASELDAFEPVRRGVVLTVAYDLLRHRVAAGRALPSEARPRSLALLRARSRQPAAREIPAPQERSDPPAAEAPAQQLAPSPPTAGHGTARVGLSGGIQDRDGFIELQIQPAYHTALDAPAGFAEGGEIVVLDTRVRYFPELDRVRLHELVLLDITTASPWRRPFRPTGWHAELGLRTRLLSSRRGRGLDTEGVFRAQGGVGAALAPGRGLHLQAFGEWLIEAAPGLQGDVATGPLARLGLTWSTPRGRYSLRAESITGLLTGPRTSAWLRFRLDHRLTLNERWSAQLGGHYERAYDVGHFEGRFGLIRYF